MESINVTTARQKLYAIIDEVNVSHKPVQIVGKRGSGILLSEEDWNDIQETLYLHSIPNLVQNILEGDNENIADMVNAEELDW